MNPPKLKFHEIQPTSIDTSVMSPPTYNPYEPTFKTIRHEAIRGTVMLEEVREYEKYIAEQTAQHELRRRNPALRKAYEQYLMMVELYR